MMNNTNYSIGLQLPKPVHTAYCGLHNLAENWSWARDVNGRDRDETRLRRWQFFSKRDRDETLVRLETVSRPRRRDRDHNPDNYVCGGHSVVAAYVLIFLLTVYLSVFFFTFYSTFPRIGPSSSFMLYSCVYWQLLILNDYQSINQSLKFVNTAGRKRSNVTAFTRSIQWM